MLPPPPPSPGCQGYLENNPAAPSGTYSFDLGADGYYGTHNLYCDFSNGIGWTRVIAVESDNRNHCTDQQVYPLASSGTYAANGKLSDTVINYLLDAGSGCRGVLKAVNPGGRTVYFRKSSDWDFNGAGTGDRSGGGASDADHSGEICTENNPYLVSDPSWSTSGLGHTNHYGFSANGGNNGCSSPGNWNYCENVASYMGSYNQGSPMQIIGWVSSKCP